MYYLRDNESDVPVEISKGSHMCISQPILEMALSAAILYPMLQRLVNSRTVLLEIMTIRNVLN